MYTLTSDWFVCTLNRLAHTHTFSSQRPRPNNNIKARIEHPHKYKVTWSVHAVFLAGGGGGGARLASNGIQYPDATDCDDSRETVPAQWNKFRTAWILLIGE